MSRKQPITRPQSPVPLSAIMAAASTCPPPPQLSPSATLDELIAHEQASNASSSTSRLHRLQRFSPPSSTRDLGNIQSRTSISTSTSTSNSTPTSTSRSRSISPSSRSPSPSPSRPPVHRLADPGEHECYINIYMLLNETTSQFKFGYTLDGPRKRFCTYYTSGILNPSHSIRDAWCRCRLAALVNGMPLYHEHDNYIRDMFLSFPTLFSNTRSRQFPHHHSAHIMSCVSSVDESDYTYA